MATPAEDPAQLLASGVERALLARIKAEDLPGLNELVEEFALGTPLGCKWGLECARTEVERRLRALHPNRLIFWHGCGESPEPPRTPSPPRTPPAPADERCDLLRRLGQHVAEASPLELGRLYAALRTEPAPASPRGPPGPERQRALLRLLHKAPLEALRELHRSLPGTPASPAGPAGPAAPGPARGSRSLVGLLERPTPRAILLALVRTADLPQLSSIAAQLCLPPPQPGPSRTLDDCRGAVIRLSQRLTESQILQWLERRASAGPRPQDPRLAELQDLRAGIDLMAPALPPEYPRAARGGPAPRF